jgi:hypothetical protein
MLTKQITRSEQHYIIVQHLLKVQSKCTEGRERKEGEREEREGGGRERGGDEN